MGNHRRRLQLIEVGLTPEQLVFLWLKNARQAGTFADGALQSPPARNRVANAVLNTAQKAMRGKPESIVDKAVLPALQEADQLYLLAVKLNYEVYASAGFRSRECLLLAGYLRAVQLGDPLLDTPA